MSASARADSVSPTDLAATRRSPRRSVSHPADAPADGTERELLGMGFNRKSVQEALRTVGSGLERALSWLLDGSAAASSADGGSGQRSRDEHGVAGRSPKVARVGGGRRSSPTPDAHDGGGSSTPDLSLLADSPPASPSGARVRPCPITFCPFSLPARAFTRFARGLLHGGSGLCMHAYSPTSRPLHATSLSPLAFPFPLAPIFQTAELHPNIPLSRRSPPSFPLYSQRLVQGEPDAVRLRRSRGQAGDTSAKAAAVLRAGHTRASE